MKRKPRGYWTYDRCKEAALKCKTRTEFSKKYGTAYNYSGKNNWLDEICSHMEIVGNIKKRAIYVFEFDDNSAYVGLTYNFKKRYNEHINNTNSSVYKHIEKTNLKPKFIKLTGFMDEEEAQKQEGIWEQKYINNGWNILNVAKTGALGGNNLKWDYETCKEEASKYKTRTEFQKNNRSAYNSSLTNDWLNEICSHMIEGKAPNGYWTYDRCKEAALKCKTRDEFQKNSVGAYAVSRKNDWLDEFLPIKKTKPSGFWNKNNCEKEASKYKTRTEFKKNNRSAYYASQRHNILDNIFGKKRMNQYN